MPHDHFSIRGSTSSFASPPNRKHIYCKFKTVPARHDEVVQILVVKIGMLVLSGETLQADTKPHLRVEARVLKDLNRCNRIHTSRLPWTRWTKRLEAGDSLRSQSV